MHAELSEFPPNSRVHLYSYAVMLKQCQNLKTKDPKDFRTLQSRIIHYFEWCIKLRIDDFSELLRNTTAERKVKQMAFYAIHLGTAHSIRGICIKANTIEKYVLVMAQMYTEITGIDPRYMVKPYKVHNAPIHKSIKSVYQELERWEKVPDLKEPVTIKMVQWLKKLQATQQTPSTSKLNAVIDWIEMGMAAGFRIGEFGQSNSNSNI